MKGKKANQRFPCFSQLMPRKRASLLQEMIIHLVLIALVFGMFFYATAGRVGTKDVKQQVLEKQIALMIDLAKPGMSFSVYRLNGNGVVSNLEIKEGSVFAYVADQKVSKGYPYFSKYSVSVKFVNGEKDIDDKYVISVTE